MHTVHSKCMFVENYFYVTVTVCFSCSLCCEVGEVAISIHFMALKVTVVWKQLQV